MGAQRVLDCRIGKLPNRENDPTGDLMTPPHTQKGKKKPILCHKSTIKAKEDNNKPKEMPKYPFLVLCAMLVVSLLASQSHLFLTTHKHDKWKAAMFHCEGRYSLPQRLETEKRAYNPRISLYDSPTAKIITNAVLLDGDGHLTETLNDVFINNGIISKIAVSGSAEAQQLQRIFTTARLEVIDAQGHIVSPGLVEMHSHIGICSQPELKGVNDMFELMSPVTPYTRVIDAFNIGDPAIQLNNLGGVTTSLVLPSANLISGEGYVLKMLVPESRSVEEMLVQWNGESGNTPNQGKRHRWMKMACGENPKKRYVSRPEAPKSRMGLGYLFREYMDRATKLKEKQDEWCQIVEKRVVPESSFPQEVEIEILVSLLRGQVSSNAHCYETFDIETILRHSKEYQFEINALHHALDAYKIPKILQSLPWNITIATFATLWGFKKEANQASLFSPEILDSNNLNVVLTTDHPALPGHTLIYQAQVAHNYGLPAEAAFASITGNSATALNLDDRIGFLRPGYDADLIIWDKHPLQPGAKPLKVFVDGQMTLDLPLEKQSDAVTPPLSRYNSKGVADTTKHKQQKDYLIKGIKNSFTKELRVTGKMDFQLLVIDGEVSCFAPECPSPESCEVIELRNGHIIPGIVAFTDAHGMVDIESEHSTGDGDIQERGPMPITDPATVLYSRDGLHMGSEHMARALNSGVTTLITPPFRSEGRRFLTGVSASFKSSSVDLSDVLKEEVALHMTFGDSGKESLLPTVSSQISILRRLLRENKDLDNVYGSVSRGELPLAAHVNGRDIMLHLLDLQKEMSFHMIIIGGLEAHLVANRLVEQQVPVIVKGWLCQRKFWDERRCLTGVGGEQTILANLTQSGVLTGLAYAEDQDVRLALDQLASAAKASTMRVNEAVDMVSTNVLNIFGIEESQRSFVVLEGSPVEFGTKIAAIIEEGVLIRKFPQPEPLYDFYH